MGVPATLLRRWYLEGTLHNTRHGFTFSLKNRLAPTTIVKVVELHAMGRVYKPEQIEIRHLLPNGRAWIRGDAVTEKRPVIFRVNDIVAVRVTGERLKPGHHLITLELETLEVGSLRVPVEDIVWEPSAAQTYVPIKPLWAMERFV